jgi:lipoprotein-anchoring transpeptidase ErfK/SrfK
MGCIRMKNIDIVELFNLVKEGTIVAVVEAL